MRVLKPRSPALAIVLSAHVPGLGQVYNGQPVKGAVWPAAGLAACAVLHWAGVWKGVPGLLWEFFVLSAVYIYLVFDAGLTASRGHDYILKPCNAWWVYLLFSLGIAAALAFIAAPMLWRHSPYTLYRIQSDSMAPALSPGDVVLAEAGAYRDQPPRRWDVAVFTCPDEGGRFCIKRVAALPGDVLEIRGGALVINGKPARGAFGRRDSPPHRDARALKRESLGPIKIYPGRCFVLGDNRDHSRDSRHYGQVPLENLAARPLMIVLSPEPGRMGMPVR